MQTNTRINNKYRVIYLERNYSKNNTIYLQQFNLEKRSKIKTIQNIFLIKTKINNNNIR